MHVVQGTLKPDGTLELDTKPELPPGRVEVTLKPAPRPLDRGFFERMKIIWDAQEARHHVPRTEEEVETEREAFRNGWEERLENLEHIRSEIEQE